MEHPVNKNITAFILAGGGSRRFGENKAMYHFRGKPLISCTTELLAGCFEHLVIVAKDKTVFRELGYPVIEDALPYQTPLVGIYTGLMYSNTGWNLFTACDMPLLTSEIIGTLVHAIPEYPDETEIIVPRTSHGLEPTIALYHKSLAESIMEDQNKTISLKDFILGSKSKIIDFESSEPFMNVNTKEQLTGLDQ